LLMCSTGPPITRGQPIDPANVARLAMPDCQERETARPETLRTAV
jgi:hypothetical protein